MSSSLQIQFLGAARTVTGSKYLLETDNSKTLVDCGLFQGLKELRERNWNPFPVPSAQIDRVILTHAHIDHTGYLPRLCKEGYRGPVYCTPSTAELLKLLLPDTGHLQEEDARFAAKKGFSKHENPLPLYTVEDARKVLGLLQTVDFNQRKDLDDGISIQYHSTGHLLGAAHLKMEIASRRLWFSGDLGRYNDEIMSPPSDAGEADVVFIESTYGDRLHPPMDLRTELEKVVKRTLQRGGSLIIPAFAIGRSQALLYHFHLLEESGRIPKLPLYVDSPMAVNATSIYCAFEHEENIRPDFSANGHGSCPLRFKEAHFTQSVEESKRINEIKTPIIIISASGMATGGRIVHHLANRITDPRNTILLVGYQAEGTRGRNLLNGAKELKMFGHLLPVKAEVANLAGLSGHGDQRDLMRWLSTFKRPPQQTFLVHGEEKGLTGLNTRIKENLKWPTYIPNYLEKVSL